MHSPPQFTARGPVRLSSPVGDNEPFGYSMISDQETFLKMVLQALGEWWTKLGAFAWLLLGLLLAGSVLVLLFLVRWIFRGGLSRHMPFGYSARRPETEQSSGKDS